MRGFLLRLILTAAGLALAAQIVPGIRIDGTWTLVWAALLFGLVNAIVRPIVVILTLPITLLTFGLFLLVINAALFGFVAWLLDGFDVAGFWPALFGWLIIWFVSLIVSWFIGPNGRYEILVIERRR